MRRTSSLQTFCSLAAILVLVTALTAAAAVAQSAPQTTVSISGQADYISQDQIIVYITVQGTGGIGAAGVNAQQVVAFGTTTGGSGVTLICDGKRRTYAVSIVGAGVGWQLGEALAGADANCPASGSDFVSKTIRITKP